jgi:hypothetical protein
MRLPFAPGLALILLTACAGSGKLERPALPAPASAPPAASASTEAGDPPVDAVFTDTVRPVLSRTCTPCHERGGRMYERLPFDDPAVVASHATPVLRRLKEPKDREVLEAWLASREDRR